MSSSGSHSTARHRSSYRNGIESNKIEFRYEKIFCLHVADKYMLQVAYNGKAYDQKWRQAHDSIRQNSL